MNKRNIGLFLATLGLLAIVGELFGMKIPTASWFFEVSREISLLNLKAGKDSLVEHGFLWFGWVASGAVFLVGMALISRSFRRELRNPATARKIRRFKEIKRAYFSLIILCGLAGLAALDQVVVGKDALAVKYDGNWYFPAFQKTQFKGSDFGISGEKVDAPVDYRELKRSIPEGSDDFVLMPLIPYASTGDTLNLRTRALVLRNGLYYEENHRQPYFGLAGTFHDEEFTQYRLRYTLRKGVFSGPVDGRNQSNESVYSAKYDLGRKVSENYVGEGDVEDFLGDRRIKLRSFKYHPAPPIWEQGNVLGTTPEGFDVLAYLYGGLQVNFKAALIFLPVVYLIGIVLGMTMGYFGGIFDLLFDRAIEIFSNMPFLFVVIIFSSMVPERYKGLPIILTILMVFGWTGITLLMRTAAYRDKGRDYVSAARVLGAGTPRVIFRHLLPNTVAIIVTLIPFTVSSLISSLTALDYLGFGLPPEYATWGRLLNAGLSNLSAPWLVSSTFFALVGLLVLITFIGEGVREAFDPKKHSYYR